jgi:hypothetical protein
MGLIPWELETSNDGNAWTTLGFTTLGGFNPYRYELKEDAERALNQMAPAGFRRVVPARSVVEKKA